MIGPTKRIHKKKWIRSTLLRSVTCRIGTLWNANKSYRYRIHKSRIRRLDPKNLNAGPDLQLYERVPIQKRGTGFKKIRGTNIKKMRYRYKTRYRIQEKLWYRYKNEGTDTVSHKEKGGTTQVKIKGWNRHQNKNSECRICGEYYQFYGTRRVPITYEERWSPALTKIMDPENFYLPEVKLCRSRGGGSGIGTGSCGDLFGRTAPLLGQAPNRARRAKTRRLHKIK